MPTRALIQEADYTCGAFSVGRMLDHYATRRAWTDIRRLDFAPDLVSGGRSMQMPDLKRLLQDNLGSANLRVKAGILDDALPTGRPFVVALGGPGGGHAVVVEAVLENGQLLRVYDPAIGILQVRTDSFRRLVSTGVELGHNPVLYVVPRK